MGMGRWTAPSDEDYYEDIEGRRWWPKEEPVPTYTPAEREQVHHIQTRLNVAVSRRDTQLVIKLMGELARLTGRPMPTGYTKG